MKKKKKLALSEQDKKCLAYARELISKDVAVHYTIQQIATEAGINRYKLNYGFKQVFGSNIHQYVTALRMQHAKHLLLETDKPVKEIAQLSGYSTRQNFITAFKKHTGLTPSQFQKRKKRL